MKDDDLLGLLCDTLAELDDREWTYMGDDGNGASIVCLSCSACSVSKDSYKVEPPIEHTSECTLKSVVDRIKAKIKQIESRA